MSSLEPRQSKNGDSAERYWRSIEELQQTTRWREQQQAGHPAPRHANSAIDRRQFAHLMTASLALAGASFTGCRRWPRQYIRPLSSRTEGYLPGVAEYFATQFHHQGVATGLLAKSMDGRPIKIEGNALHPFSKGSAGVFAEASILELYDPDRTRGYIYRPANAPHLSADSVGAVTNTSAIQYSREFFENIMTAHFAALKSGGGRGLHVLAQASGSPTFNRMRQAFQSSFPEARWHVYQSVDRDREFAGSRMAFDRVVRPQYKLQNARTIVTFDADLLGTHPGHLKWCRDWAEGRNPDSQDYSRLWTFETGYTITGGAADFRHPVLPSQMAGVVLAIARELGLATAVTESGSPTQASAFELESDLHGKVRRLVRELQQSRSRSLLVAGPSLAPEVQALTHAINHHLGNFGTTIDYTDEPLAESKSCVDAAADLVGALHGKSVDTLVILGGNPVYDFPCELKLELHNQPRLTSVYLGLFDNETAGQCTWHAPVAHYLEMWNDGRAWDGSYGVGQPLIYPLFNGISEIEFLSLATGQPVGDGMELVRETASLQFGVGTDKQWNRLLHDGVLEQSKFETIAVRQPNMPVVAGAESVDGFEVCFVAGTSVFDGRFANNAWLQELPDPLTGLTWGNAALVSKRDADQFGLDDGDEIAIEVGPGYRIDGVPVLIQPGQTPQSISLPLGYGRQTGNIARGIGASVEPLRTSADRYVARGATLARTGKHQELACTQEHHLLDPVGMAGRTVRVGERSGPGRLVRETTLSGYRQNPHEVHAGFHVPAPAPLFDPPDPFDSPSAWGMSIDLNACVGCNACVVACQAENNIPVVGKVNVLQNREMHWLRIDRYYKGGIDSPDVVHVPMACAHCEDAPCEQVCPVAATVHDTEGLNAMVYNRCVGTRYCANNCPFKVRRFNYFDYHATKPTTPAQPWLDIPDQQQRLQISELEQMVFNPDVSVRMRGVMEKCSYCVQRISAARIQARNEHARGKREFNTLVDGDVITACQQACPTTAIRFGDLNDVNSAVSRAHHNDRAYSMLEETNIKPRTRFLARIRNVDSDEIASREENHGQD